MGGGCSTDNGGHIDEANLFAFKVARRDYELLSDSGLSDVELQSHLADVFTTALNDFTCESVLDCVEPCSILVKIDGIQKADVRKDVMSIIFDALTLKEKGKKAPVGDADYSKGFSGSAADTKAEKDFEKMMREAGGGEDPDEFAQFPVLRPPRIRYREQEAALRVAGPWCRVLSASGCYMYCHCLTRAVVSIRPDEYEDDDGTGGLGEEGGGGADEVPLDPANGLQSCHITELPAMLDRLLESGQKTPLVLDGTEGHLTLTFFSMKAMLEDISGLVVPYAVSGIKRTDVMEKCRARLVGALKSGSMFALYLGGVTVEHADFKKKLCKKDIFPVEVFQEWGRKLFTPKSNPRFKVLYREEEMDSGTKCPVARDDFKFICISTVSPHEYEEKLGESLPLGYMTALYVHNKS